MVNGFTYSPSIFAFMDCGCKSTIFRKGKQDFGIFKFFLSSYNWQISKSFPNFEMLFFTSAP